jgi:hypothetical protein
MIVAQMIGNIVDFRLSLISAFVFLAMPDNRGLRGRPDSNSNPTAAASSFGFSQQARRQLDRGALGINPCAGASRSIFTS